MRNVILAGNWKMNETPAQARQLLEQLRESLPKTSHEVVIFPPYLVLEHAAKAGFVKVGAQNCHFEEKGAFTGELSLSMLCEVGAACVLVGHSERRQYFAETDETVRKKIAAALTKGVTPFVCVGETLPQREAGGYLEFVTGQLEAALSGLDGEAVKRTVVAYEPVWAIGTGVTATAEQAQEVCAALRGWLADRYGKEVAQEVSILYGGSMNAKNAAELLKKPDIDGGLIGGASLIPEEFASIVKTANEVKGGVK